MYSLYISISTIVAESYCIFDVKTIIRPPFQKSEWNTGLPIVEKDKSSIDKPAKTVMFVTAVLVTWYILQS